ncbi:hypothetical protein ACIBCH_20515 [Amycolatopsis thailandensis]|uniref:hypothetical protein n=1 Tax=Amycolatopsis thailandensis TaxID=589330 RepID=UPI0037B578A8
MPDEAVPTVWKIALRDELRATMCTNPTPLWAPTESEKDWVLEHLLHRPREDYVAEEVPEHDHVAREQERFKRVRRELSEQERARRFPTPG